MGETFLRSGVLTRHGFSDGIISFPGIAHGIGDGAPALGHLIDARRVGRIQIRHFNAGESIGERLDAGTENGDTSDHATDGDASGEARHGEETTEQTELIAGKGEALG